MSSRSDPDPTHAPGADDARHARRRGLRVSILGVGDDQLAVKTGTGVAAVEAIEREAAILRQLRHPNVVDLVRVEHAHGGASIVTQFAGSVTLAEVAPTDVSEVARLGASLLTVMGDLHSMGWTHGRLRAEHCILSDDGRLTLCAFGAAHRAVRSDPRRAADVAAVIGIIGALADLLPTPITRAERRQARRLHAALATATAGRADDGAVEHLRADLTELSGAAPAASAPRTALARYRRFAGDPDPTIRSGRTHRRARRRSVSARSDGEATTRRTTTAAPPPAWRGILVLSGTLIGLFATVSFLRWVGGPLGAAPAAGVRRLHDLPDPVVLALTIVRAVAFAACLYGIAISTAALAAILTRRRDIERLATSMAPPRLRRALVGLIGLGMMASVATGPSSRGPRSPEPMVTTPAPSPAPTSLDRTTDAIDAVDAVAVEPVVSPAPAHPSTPVPDPVPAPAPVPLSALPRMWVIEPGDHLWAVATTTLEDHLGHEAGADEVDGYWRRLVDLNRASLLDPDNPDLVFAGQVIELPPLP